MPFVRCATCVLSFVWCARLSQFTPSLIYLFFALSCSSSLVARFAGGDLHYHGAGLRAGRRSGIVDVERFANGLLVYCDCNLDIVAAWHKLAHQNPAFLVAVGPLAGPFEINHDAPLVHFGIEHGHPHVFGGKSEASRGIIGLAGSLVVSSASSQSSRYAWKAFSWISFTIVRVVGVAV